MEGIEYNITDDEDFLELIEIIHQPERRPQLFRERQNHFTLWNEEDFRKRFRFSKEGVRYILEQILHEISLPTERNHAVSPEEMLLMTLRFYATGSFLQVIGDFVGIDKSTASRHIWRVTQAIAHLYPNFINMPETHAEMQAKSLEFYNLCRFPRCIAALDCTHVRILSPGGDNAEIFRNRKGYFSYNVQAVCDAKCVFMDVVCRWPGSAHDAQIFGNSTLRAKFERGDFNDFLILGDSAYAVKQYLMPPLRNPITRAEQLFNKSQIRTRNTIERLFGTWKRRFPILAYGIRLKHEKVEGIVIASAVLHNISKLLNEPELPIDEGDEAAINFVNNMPREHLPQYNILNINDIVRRQLITEYFATLI